LPVVGAAEERNVNYNQSHKNIKPHSSVQIRLAVGKKQIIEIEENSVSSKMWKGRETEKRKHCSEKFDFITIVTISLHVRKSLIGQTASARSIKVIVVKEYRSARELFNLINFKRMNRGEKSFIRGGSIVESK
jgi:hypothetical protein